MCNHDNYAYECINSEQILMPINEKFIEVFEIFMNNEQKNKIRANNVRQYIEGIIDLLLRDKIIPSLSNNEQYSNINWKRKIKIIKENYDINIANKIEYIFKIGADGSHFNGNVKKEDLDNIINYAIHIVEDIFIKYFLDVNHTFGTENVLTIFSLLPLKNRIYILENLCSKDTHNKDVIDRLSLAYLKNGQKDKSIIFLNDKLNNNLIDDIFYKAMLHKINLLDSNLEKLHELNKDYYKSKQAVVLIGGNQMMIGLPSSKNIFDTEKAVGAFKKWFCIYKDNYKEFINIFMALMATDDREYK